MQIAALSYHYNSKDNRSNDSRGKYQRRHIVTTVNNPVKKRKPQSQQRSFLPDISTNSTNSLPTINKNSKRPSSIRVKGNGLQSSKLTDASISSFHQPSRSRSRQSNRSDNNNFGMRSRSITPSGEASRRSSSKLVRLKFGYPVKIRSADFYASDLSEPELRYREDSFVNDSIRTSNEKFRSSKTFSYNALNDPNLKNFFQSPIVLDVVRKTLNIDLEPITIDKKKRSKRNHSNTSYHQIVAKQSSGYGKLNGYDCLPSFAPGRQHRSLTHDRYQTSANTSITSLATQNTSSKQQKRKSRSKNKSKPLTPISTPSPLRHQPTSRTDALETNVQKQN